MASVEHELVHAGLEPVAAQQGAGHHGGAALRQDVRELVERLAGVDGIGHERRHPLAVDHRHRPDPPGPAGPVSEQHQAVDPGTDEHDVGGGEVL